MLSTGWNIAHATVSACCIVCLVVPKAAQIAHQHFAGIHRGLCQLPRIQCTRLRRTRRCTTSVLVTEYIGDYDWMEGNIMHTSEGEPRLSITLARLPTYRAPLRRRMMRKRPPPRTVLRGTLRRRRTHTWQHSPRRPRPRRHGAPLLLRPPSMCTVLPYTYSLTDSCSYIYRCFARYAQPTAAYQQQVCSILWPAWEMFFECAVGSITVRL